jgi:AcrR family transcriptional regulator
MTGECDPRVARSRAAVLEATVALLGEVGHRGTTVEAVAERSGVAKTTIYRHWPTRAMLLFDAFHSLIDMDQPALSGDVRTDLVGLAKGLARKLRDPQWSGLMTTLTDAAQTDEELAELSATFTRSRREVARQVLERGVASGQLREGADTAEAASLVGGALFYYRMMLREPATDADVERLVDLVLDGLRRRD